MLTNYQCPEVYSLYLLRTNNHEHGVIWSWMWCPESYDSLRIQNTHKYADPLESPDLRTTCKNISWSPVTICPKSNGGCKESSWNAFTSCLWRCRNKSENNCWFLTKILLIFVYRIKFLCSFEELKKQTKIIYTLLEWS